MTTNTFTYQRTGTMHYQVTEAVTGSTIGELWRTRDGWRARTVSGRIIEFFGVSRAVAAGCLAQED